MDARVREDLDDLDLARIPGFHGYRKLDVVDAFSELGGACGREGERACQGRRNDSSCANVPESVPYDVQSKLLGVRRG